MHLQLSLDHNSNDISTYLRTSEMRMITLGITIVLHLLALCYLTSGFLEKSRAVGIIRPSAKAFVNSATNKRNHTSIDEDNNHGNDGENSKVIDSDDTFLASILESSAGNDFGYRWDVLAGKKDMEDTGACYNIVSECVACLCDTVIIEVDYSLFENELEFEMLLVNVCNGLEEGAKRRQLSQTDKLEGNTMRVALWLGLQDNTADLNIVSKLKELIADKINNPSDLVVIRNLSELQEFTAGVYTNSDEPTTTDTSGKLNNPDEYSKFISILIEKLNIVTAFKSFDQRANVRLEGFKNVDLNSFAFANDHNVDLVASASEIESFQKKNDFSQGLSANDNSANDQSNSDSLAVENQNVTHSDVHISVENEITETVEILISKLRTLESKQDDATLDISRPPVLEFGREANAALSSIWRTLDDLESKYKKSTKVFNRIKSLRSSVLNQYVFSDSSGSVFSLLHQQLSNVREYFGQKYESSIENIVSKYTNLDEQEKRIAAAAAQTVEGFKAAARHSVPALLQSDDSFQALTNEMCDGLVRDLMTVTEEQQEIDRDWSKVVNLEEIEDDDENGSSDLQRKPAKWYKKLAARALVLGVNYVQGLIVLHGLRQAAAERDKMMPKFPLF